MSLKEGKGYEGRQVTRRQTRRLSVWRAFEPTMFNAMTLCRRSSTLVSAVDASVPAQLSQPWFSRGLVRGPPGQGHTSLRPPREP